MAKKGETTFIESNQFEIKFRCKQTTPNFTLKTSPAEPLVIIAEGPLVELGTLGFFDSPVPDVTDYPYCWNFDLSVS